MAQGLKPASFLLEYLLPLEIARDVAKKLLEAQAERHQQAKLMTAKDSFDYPLILGT